MKNPKSITVVGRRWFQKSAGNTCHSVSIVADGVRVGSVYFAYGYGEQYLQTAAARLKKDGYLSDMEDNEMLWKYCERKGIKLTYEAVDVQRRKDL